MQRETYPWLRVSKVDHDDYVLGLESIGFVKKQETAKDGTIETSFIKDGAVSRDYGAMLDTGGNYWIIVG